MKVSLLLLTFLLAGCRENVDVDVVCYDPTYASTDAPVAARWVDQDQAQCQRGSCYMRKGNVRTWYKMPEGVACAVSP